MWKTLYKTIAIRPTLGEAIALPTDKSLNEFERRRAFRLPHSYREFVKVFGAGELGGYFRIYSPDRAGIEASNDLDAYMDSFDEARSALLEFLDNPGCVERMVPFSDTIGGDVIGWDPADITNRRTNEYAIYVVTRSDTRILRLASTFSNFVREVCLGSRFAAAMNMPEFETPQEFVPYGVQ